MVTKRGVAAALLLSANAGLAALGVAMHYGLVEMYGNTRRSSLENWAQSFGEGGVSGVALVLVMALTMPAFVVATGRVTKVLALTTPLLMVLAMLLVTPLALEEKRQWLRADGGGGGLASRVVG